MKTGNGFILGLTLLFCHTLFGPLFGQNGGHPPHSCDGHPVRMVGELAAEQRAWAVFARINQAVDASESARLEWETWALAREVYADPHRPPDWEASSRGIRFHAFLRMRKEKFKEIRMNQQAFDYIMAHHLYHLEGQMEMHRLQRAIRFPEGTCHVSALWQVIDPDQAPEFHAIAVDAPGGGEPQWWGMAAMHISFKQDGQWLWATWEHYSNPKLALDQLADMRFFPQSLQGSLWENYRLVGTQTDFTNPDGSPSLLANSELEVGMEANTSSCITCHARASISDRFGDTRLPVFEFHDRRRGSVGPPDPEWFFQVDGPTPEAEPKYSPTDFVWSLKRARSHKANTSGSP